MADDATQRYTRRFAVWSVLFLVAVALLWVVVAPACKDIYTDFGSPLPRITLIALTWFVNWGLLLLIAAAVTVAAAGALLFSVPSEARLRRYAWLAPAAGLTSALAVLVLLVFPVLSLPR